MKSSEYQNFALSATSVEKLQHKSYNSIFIIKKLAHIKWNSWKCEFNADVKIENNDHHVGE